MKKENGERQVLKSAFIKNETYEEPDTLGFFIVVFAGLEALTFALWVNSPDRLKSLLWALPLITTEAFSGLLALQKWSDKRKLFMLKAENGEKMRYSAKAEY